MGPIRGLAIVALSFALTACVGLGGGPIAKYNGPTGNFADTHGGGFTVGAQAELALTAFSIYGDAGWTRFSGEDSQEQSHKAVDGLELAAGARMAFGPAFVGAQYGRATGAFDQSLLRPEVGLRLGRLMVFGQYQTLERTWWSIGGGLSTF
jgi:hypothetical protein